MKCNNCDSVTINGVFFHEAGCPDLSNEACCCCSAPLRPQDIYYANEDKDTPLCEGCYEDELELERSLGLDALPY